MRIFIDYLKIREIVKKGYYPKLKYGKFIILNYPMLTDTYTLTKLGLYNSKGERLDPFYFKGINYCFVKYVEGEGMKKGFIKRLHELKTEDIQVSKDTQEIKFKITITKDGNEEKAKNFIMNELIKKATKCPACGMYTSNIQKSSLTNEELVIFGKCSQCYSEYSVEIEK